VLVDHVIIFVQVLALLIGSWAIILTFQFFQKFRYDFVKSYFFFILFDNIVAIKVFMTSYLFVNVFTKDVALFNRIYYLVINPIGLFLSLGLFFFYARLAFQIRESKVNSKIHYGLTTVFLFVIFVYVIGIILFLKSGTKTLLEYASTGMIFLFFALVILFTIWLLVTNRSNSSPGRTKVIRIFGFFYLTLFMANFLGIFVSEIPSLALFIQVKYMLVLLTMNIFPIIWLKIFFLKKYIQGIRTIEGERLIDQVARKYGFSEREKEIMALIIEGKSNKEIEERLSISFHTVKNHIYNIFKKSGVNSRSQLINFILKQKS